jgi:hypothetical protein
MTANHAAGRYGFRPPGDRGTHGADPAALQVLRGCLPQRLAVHHRLDRKASAAIIADAQDLMAYTDMEIPDAANTSAPTIRVLR